ncbi:MAG: aspartate dehydrogenase [Lachnospiraceae bacterium]|nr:aspartate dehydrogenase [Lachnospiraceae bacterium]
MFGRKQKKVPTKTFDRETKKPVIKCSICNGEQTAGFLEIRTGQFEEIMLIRSQSDLEQFIALYQLNPKEITKIY